ncbi:MAG: caspase family protein [Betaproteobacteria bacterium]
MDDSFFSEKRSTLLKLGALSLSPLVSSSLFASSIHALPRNALVIGNSAYPDMPLLNPSNDANAIGAELKRLGFAVDLQVNARRDVMENAMLNFSNLLSMTKSVGLFYFAGHGLQLDWRNYLVPVDARINKADDVSRQTVEIGSLLNRLGKAGNPMNIVILDACRDNPFGSEKGAAKGLSQMDAPTGTLLAYATAPGNVASDGSGKNGLYTENLLKEMRSPEARIEDVFKRVRISVRRASQGQQIPWESTSLEDDFFFIPPASLRKQSEDELEQLFAKEKAEWDKIKGSKNADDFYAYLAKYPNGRISEQATFVLERLSKAKVLPQKDKNGVLQIPAAQRFRIGDEYLMSAKDNNSNREIEKFTLKVDRIADGLVYLKGSRGDEIRTEDGATKSAYATDGLFEYDPPVPMQPGDIFQVGKSWVSESIQTFKGKKTSRIDSAKVVAFEEIRIGSVTYKTFRVEIDVSLKNGLSVKNTFWFEPGWGVPVKRIRVGFSKGVQYVNQSYELVSRTRGAG